MIALADNRDKAVINQKGMYIQPGKETMVSIKGRDIFYTYPASRHNVNIRKCYQIVLYDIATFLRGFW